MLMDHGTPWWNMKAVAGWTWLTVWLMKQGIRLHFSGYRHPQTQGKVERFTEHWLPRPSAEDIRVESVGRRGWMNFAMSTTTCGPRSAADENTRIGVERKYTPLSAQLPVWEYEAGAEVRRLTAQGRLRCAGRNWEISRALAGEWVQLIRVEERILVYYCRSLVRELDWHRKCSTAVDHWVSGECKGC